MKSFKIPQGSSSKEDFLNALDNSISALGKILKFVEFNEDIFLLWLSKMPIKLDTLESKAMNKFLSEIILEKPGLIIGEHKERLEFLIVLLGSQLQELHMEKETIEVFCSIL